MKLVRPFVPHDIETLTPSDLVDGLRRAIRADGHQRRPVRLLLAVSGGPDSLGLLILAICLPREQFSVFAATVDHGLRHESSAEASYVADVCHNVNVPHRILNWGEWNGRGNLQAAAREARYRLLLREAHRIGASTILTAHHLDDQFETVLHALERGDGRERSAGMRSCRDLDPFVRLVRPLLDFEPRRLHAVLAASGIDAILDPSNDDESYARIRHRRAIAAMSAARRAELCAFQRNAATKRMSGDQALAAAIGNLLEAKDLRFDETGTVMLSRPPFRSLPSGLASRLLSRVLTAAGGRDHAPDRERVKRLSQVMRSTSEPVRVTLSGASITSSGDRIEVAREYGRFGPPRIFVPWSAERHAFDNRFDLILSEEERALAERRGAVLAGFGVTGKGNSRVKSLPCLVAQNGEVLVAHPKVAERLGSKTSKVEGFTTLRCRVGWRALVDLPITTGRR